MYNVGFGDCFLLTVPYRETEGGDRHILIDFGSTGRPPGAPADWMRRIAEDIRTRCDGQLTAVVVTHRHQDHLRGFATGGRSPGDLIASLNPERIVQPWTEHPDAEPDAAAPPEQRERIRERVSAFAFGQSFARDLGANLQRLSSALEAAPNLLQELEFLGSENIRNESAVKNLIRMAKSDRGSYVHFGAQSGLEELLPGVEVDVLGPPSLEQSDSIRRQRTRNEEEYWHLQADLMHALTSGETIVRPPEGHHADTSSAPPAARWFMRRMEVVRAEQVLSIVRILDSVLNNTSLILLFGIDGKRLLFPGDAQIENWAYALEHQDVRAKLAESVLYKVGHHGSLNGTPRTLWRVLTGGSVSQEARLVCLLSTLRGKHGNPSRGTEVPREKLIEELSRGATLHSTERFEGEMSREFEL